MRRIVQSKKLSIAISPALQLNDVGAILPLSDSSLLRMLRCRLLSQGSSWNFLGVGTPGIFGGTERGGDENG